MAVCKHVSLQPHCYLLMVEIDLLTILERELDSRKGKGFLSWQPAYQPRSCQSKMQKAFQCQV